MNVPLVDEALAERGVLLVGAVAPLDAVGLEDRRPVLDPVEELADSVVGGVVAVIGPCSSTSRSASRSPGV